MDVSPFCNLPYTKTIRIIRHPVDSIYSYYVWVQNEKKQPVEYLIPRDFLLKAIQSWTIFQTYWNQAKNVLTIRYEDLYNDPVYHLRLVFNIIGYQITNTEIRRVLALHPPIGGLNKHFDHFTSEDLDLIQQKLGVLMGQFGYD